MRHRHLGPRPRALGGLHGRDEDEDDEERKRQRRSAERHLPRIYRDWRYADIEKLKEALNGLLRTQRGQSVLKGMPARRKGKKRQGEDNCPHQRNYLETLLDGSLCHRYTSEEDKEVVLDLTGLILYHYNWIDLNEIMVCMADVHDEAVPVSNEQAPTSDGEDGGSASDDLPDMSAPPTQCRFYYAKKQGSSRIDGVSARRRAVAASRCPEPTACSRCPAIQGCSTRSA